jgi:hypothetical protein
MIKVNANIFSIIGYFFIFFIPAAYILGNSAINIIFVSLAILLLLHSFFLKDWDWSKDNLIIILSLFFLYLFINFSFSDFAYNNIISYFGILRFLLLPFAIFVFVKSNYNKFEYLKLFYLFINFFVCFDIIFQYFFNISTFGYSVDKINSFGFISQGNIRLSGPFGKELIAGTFLSTVGILALLLNYDFLNNKKVFGIKLFYFFFTLNILSIILTGDRSPLVLISYFLFFCIILAKNYRLLFFKIFIILIFLFSILFLLSKSTHYRYYNNIVDLLDLSSNKNNSNVEKKDPISIFQKFKDTAWGSHYLVSIEMIKKHPLFGSGYRGFRKECDKYYYIESKSKDVRCTTHPHNSFLELLSETGTVGVIIFFIFLYRLILDSFKDSGYKNKKILFLCLLLAIFNPIKPTGSFFSSWYGSIFWFILGFFIIENKLNKYKSEK